MTLGNQREYITGNISHGAGFSEAGDTERAKAYLLIGWLHDVPLSVGLLGLLGVWP